MVVLFKCVIWQDVQFLKRYCVGGRHDDYGALVEWYEQGKMEVVGEKPLPVPLWLPKTSPSATLTTTNLSQCHFDYHKPLPVPLWLP
jgi:hypothetical protein